MPAPELDSLAFARAVRRVTLEAARLGLEAHVGFRSPPRAAGHTRTLRRTGRGQTWICAVAIRGRPAADVVADMADGIIAANGLTADAASPGHRAALIEAALRQPVKPPLA